MYILFCHLNQVRGQNKQLEANQKAKRSNSHKFNKARILKGRLQLQRLGAMTLAPRPYK